MTTRLSPACYDDLVTAGYPLFSDLSLAHPGKVGPFDSIIDLRVKADGRVVVNTNGKPPHEHDMGQAGELFLAWYRKNAADDR